MTFLSLCEFVAAHLQTILSHSCLDAQDGAEAGAGFGEFLSAGTAVPLVLLVVTQAGRGQVLLPLGSSEHSWGALPAPGSLSQIRVYFYKFDFFHSLIMYLIFSFFLF